MIVSVLAAAATVAAFDCEIEVPKAIGFEGGKVTSSEIGLPPAVLRFSIRVEEGNPLQASVAWPNDPLRLAGKFPAVRTAESSYAFSAYSAGPCLFTDQGCLTQFNVVGSSDGSASLIIAPVALATDEKSGKRSPFAVLARGKCSKSGNFK